MKIDQTHRSWLFTSVVILIVATVIYIPYAIYRPGGPSGNSAVGISYGIAGYSMMLFAGLLGARKKVPLWRIGRAKTWMRGHLWLGGLSLPIILFHAGFRARGPLTLVLIVLLTVVVLSGLTGAALQHYLPRRITSEVRAETVYLEIPHVREQLTAEAGAIIEKLCVDPSTVTAAATSFETGRTTVLTADDDDPAAELSDADRARLHKVYVDSIFPFLRDPEGESPLADKGKAAIFFEALRRQSPPAIHGDIETIENICDEQRQLTRQRRMHMVLHGWLLVHVPLSITLLVLGGIHALVAIRY